MVEVQQLAGLREVFDDRLGDAWEIKTWRVAQDFGNRREPISRRQCRFDNFCSILHAARRVCGPRVPLIFADFGKLPRLDPILSRKEIVQCTMNELVAVITRNEDAVELSCFHKHLPSIDTIKCEQIELLARQFLSTMSRNASRFGHVRDAL